MILPWALYNCQVETKGNNRECATVREMKTNAKHNKKWLDFVIGVTKNVMRIWMLALPTWKRKKKKNGIAQHQTAIQTIAMGKTLATNSNPHAKTNCVWMRAWERDDHNEILTMTGTHLMGHTIWENVYLKLDYQQRSAALSWKVAITHHQMNR